LDFRLNLSTETIDRISPAEPLAVTPETTIRAALKEMKETGDATLLICRDEKLVGIFTERDALKLLSRGADLEASIESVMSAEPVTLVDGDVVASAIKKMDEGNYRRLPVVDAQGRPKGVVKAAGILHYLVEHFPTVVYTLPPRPNQVSDKREGA